MPRVIRVVTLEASSTFGYCDRDNETCPHYLEEILEEAAIAVAFEVSNFATPHRTSTRIVELFNAEVLPLDADVVTFYEGINDASRMPEEKCGSRNAKLLFRQRDCVAGAGARAISRFYVTPVWLSGTD